MAQGHTGRSTGGKFKLALVIMIIGIAVSAFIDALILNNIIAIPVGDIGMTIVYMLIINFSIMSAAIIGGFILAK